MNLIGLYENFFWFFETNRRLKYFHFVLFVFNNLTSALGNARKPRIKKTEFKNRIKRYGVIFRVNNPKVFNLQIIPI